MSDEISAEESAIQRARNILMTVTGCRLNAALTVMADRAIAQQCPLAVIARRIIRDDEIRHACDSARAAMY